MDTAKLIAAVETLREYCEQVRHVMVARGYPKARVFISRESGSRFGTGNHIGVYDDETGATGASFFRPTEFEKALAYAESRPRRATEADIAATLGITPDGRVLEGV
jgi:hypothetical protein